MELTAGVRVNPDNVRVFSARVAVKETVELFAVAVEIQDKPDFPFLAYLLDERFNRCNFRAILVLLCYTPVSIEVFSCQVGPVVSEDHSVRIHHGYHVDDVVFEQKVCLFVFSEQPINHSFADVGSLRLSRMLPRHHYDCLSEISLFVDGLSYD